MLLDAATANRCGDFRAEQLGGRAGDDQRPPLCINAFAHPTLPPGDVLDLVKDETC